MEDEFKPGDLVHLKSGSPKMVVIAVHDDFCHVIGHVYGSKEFIEQNIHKVALRKHT